MTSLRFGLNSRRAMMLSIPMQMLKIGETAVVDSLIGDLASTNRLREMGLQDGVEVQMVRTGDCCIVRLGNRRLGFRCDETACVLVRIDAAGDRR